MLDLEADFESFVKPGPDFSCDFFFLFPSLKMKLAGKRYSNKSAPGSAIFRCLQSINVPVESYKEVFQGWKSRLLNDV